MHRLILLLSLLTGLAVSPVYAQSNWASATVVTSSGEEMSGYLESRPWNFRIRQLRFREQTEGATIKLQLADVRSFRIGERRYLVRDVTLNTSPRNPRALVSAEEATTKKLRVALLVLLEGPRSLYEYVDELTNRHYFTGGDDGSVIYLDFARFATEKRNSKTFYRESNVFRGVLMSLMKDCFRLRPEITRVAYTREALLELFDNYYRCAGDTPAYRLSREGGFWSVGVNAGIVRALPTYGEIERNIYPFTDLESIDPVFGAHLKYRFGGKHGTVALRLAGQYHSFSLTTSVPDPEEEDPGVASTFQYNYSERAIHLQLGPEIILVRSRYPLYLETMAEYHRVLSYRESRFNRRLVNGQEEIDGLFYSFGDRGVLSLSAGFGMVIGNARLSLRGSASRRKYPTYVLNLYRVGLMGSYDF